MELETGTEKKILDFLEFEAPTQEQENVLLAMSRFVSKSNRQDFLILSGAAGTGKTSITTALIGYLASEKTEFRVAAPTGRAARILGRKSGAPSTTIHSLIYTPSSNPDTGEVFFQLRGNSVEAFTIFILDEASMISSLPTRDDGSLFVSTNSLLHDLIAFAKEGNPSNKLILLGDRNQLPPVHEDFSGALSAEYLRHTYGLTGEAFQLTEVKRQQKDSYILRNAVALREALDNKMPAEALTDIARQSMRAAALNYVQEYRTRGFDNSISIAASHKMNRVFNTLARGFLFGDIEELLVPGELLLINQTWRRKLKELYSGDHVIVEEVDLAAVEVVAGLRFVPIKLRFRNLRDHEELVEDVLLLDSILHPKGLKAEQERRLRYERRKANETYGKSGIPSDDRYVGAIRAIYGYSITCHKAQGGEWNKVYINDFYMPGLRYQYTAITRAREELVLY